MEACVPRLCVVDGPSPFEKVRVLDPEPATGMLDAAMRNVARDFPAFRGVAVAERWAGLIDVTPDAVPVISGIEAMPGLFAATGFSGHGFGIGPGAGRSEEHTSELQSLMRISYVVFCLKNKKISRDRELTIFNNM